MRAVSEQIGERPVCILYRLPTPITYRHEVGEGFLAHIILGEISIFANSETWQRYIIARQKSSGNTMCGSIQRIMFDQPHWSTLFTAVNATRITFRTVN